MACTFVIDFRVSLMIIFIAVALDSMGQDSTALVNQQRKIVEDARRMIENKKGQTQELSGAVKSAGQKNSLSQYSISKSNLIEHPVMNQKAMLLQRQKRRDPVAPVLRKKKDALGNLADQPIQFEADKNGDNLDQIGEQGKNSIKSGGLTEIASPTLDDYVKMPDKEKLDLNTLQSPLLKDVTGEDLANSASEISKAATKVLSLEEPNIFGEQQPPSLSALTKVYSEKTIQKIKDSLEVTHAGKMLGMASALTRKKVSQEEYLKAVNEVAPDNKLFKSVNLENGTIEKFDEQKFSGLDEQIKSGDLSAIQLPDSVLSTLEPLRNLKVPEKYVKLADSLREVNFSKLDIQMVEKKVSDETKAVIAKRKPKFLDAFFVEAIVGYFKDGETTLYQGSPTLSYYLAKSLSVGAGPNILLRAEEEKLDFTVGLRALTKLEVFKQRAYIQIEDNVAPARIVGEGSSKHEHMLLAGAGVLLPLSKRIAFNACLLHRLNTSSLDQSSPWVFRLGISSLKIK